MKYYNHILPVILLAICKANFVASFNLTDFPTLALAEDDQITSRPPLLAQTHQGLLLGITLETSSNKTVSSFLGVPYARAPINELRFKPPLEPLSWSGVRPADTQPPSCMQRPDLFFEGDFEGAQAAQPTMPPSEDCLYLNVFVPDIQVRVYEKGSRLHEANIIGKGLPVMVWLHGGGFSAGSSLNRGPALDEGWTPDPRELASSGQVIVVSIQYRLGSFGFLFLNDDQAPGNVGILDQQQALTWIKTNIAAFGGDPNKITLFGQDSGGVLALLAMTNSKLGIHRAILQSSGIQHPWSYVEPREAFRRALNLASLVGCPTSASTSKSEVIQCLLSKSSEEILNKELGVVSRPGINYQPFVPTSDGQVLQMEPSKLLPRLAERLKNCQILVGTNEDEGSKALMYFLPQFFPNWELTKPQLENNDFDEAVSKMFSYFPPRIVEAIRFQYTNWANPDDNLVRFQGLQRLVSDWHYACPVDHVTETLSRASTTSIFKYRFAARNPFDTWPQWSGVNHGEEFDYVFGRPLASHSNFPDKDKLVSVFMMDTWAKFAQHGNPNGPQRDLSHQIGWPQYKFKSKHVLKIDNANENTMFTIIHEDLEENCAFWNNLLPKLMDLTSEECAKNQEETLQFQPLKATEKPRVSTTKPRGSSTTTASTSTTTSASTMPPKIRKAQASINQLNAVESLRKKSELYADFDDESYKVVQQSSTATITKMAGRPLDIQFIPNQSTQVSFRMGVRNPEIQIGPIDGIEAWHIYNSDKSGDDPVLVNPVSTSTTASTSTVTTTSTSTTTTTTTTTSKKVIRKPTRMPTWKPGVYDPFAMSNHGTKGYFRDIPYRAKNILRKRVEIEPAVVTNREENQTYFPL